MWNVLGPGADSILEADCRFGFKEMTPGRERPPSHRRGPWGVL